MILTFMINRIVFSPRNNVAPGYAGYLLFFLLHILTAVQSANAWETLTGKLDIKCMPQEVARLTCHYRMLDSEYPYAIHGDIEGTKIDIVEHEMYPWADAKTAILIMVDTSDPARQDVIDKNIHHIEQLLQSSQPHHQIGLAAFDKQLRLEAPPGTPNDNIITSLRTLRASGKTTELYRNVIEGIKIMADFDADRKAIYLLSDGQAEDRAYYHQDAIKAAREAGVVIISLGYPRSVPLSVALQTLRRLSEETGGRFIEAGNDYQLPRDFLDSPFDYIDNGGSFTVFLNTPQWERAGREGLTFVFKTNAGDFTTQIPASIMSSMTAINKGIQPGNHQSNREEPVKPAPGIVSHPDDEQDANLWLWYGLPILIVVLAGALIIIPFVRHQQLGTKRQAHISELRGLKPFAYLVARDEKAERYPITSTTWRIGRSEDNELILQDNSVSRRHAEIHRYSNGSFILFDIDSSNGLYVNNELIKKKKLQEGDIIKIGDISLRFSLYSSDYRLDDATMILK